MTSSNVHKHLESKRSILKKVFFLIIICLVITIPTALIINYADSEIGNINSLLDKYQKDKIASQNVLDLIGKVKMLGEKFITGDY